MNMLPATRKSLQLIPALLLLIAFVLLIAGFLIEFVGRPERGGEGFGFYLVVMRSSALSGLLGTCLVISQTYARSDGSLDRQRFLPFSTALLLWIGCLLIFAGTLMEITGWPKIAGQRSLLYNFAIDTGAFTELIAGLSFRRWYVEQKSRSNEAPIA